MDYYISGERNKLDTGQNTKVTLTIQMPRDANSQVLKTVTKYFPF